MSYIYDLTLGDWVLVAVCAFLIGASKAGLVGLGTLTIPLFANVFGGKPSTGIILPMLAIADIMAVKIYSGYVNWKYIKKTAIFILIGLFSAVYLGSYINDSLFKILLALTIIIGLILMIWKEIRNDKIDLPDNFATNSVTGFFGGFSSMIGNAAGPVFSIYLLPKRLPKEEFIGTYIWFFFLMNIVKLPLHGFVWHTITIKSLVFDVLMIPALVIGSFTGKYVVSLLADNSYRYLVILATLATVIIMLI